MQSVQPLVFVYGTLKHGFPNHHLNRGVRLPGIYRTASPFSLFLVGERHSPCLIDGPGGKCKVTGEVYRVDADSLREMDRLERVGHEDGYHRRLISVERIADRQMREAFAYFKTEDQLAPGDRLGGHISVYTQEHAARYRRRERF